MENNFLKPDFNRKNQPQSSLDSNTHTKIEDHELDRFNDSHGLTVKRLNIGLWFVERKEKLRKIYKILLVIFSVVTWGFALYTLADYFVFGVAADEKLYQQMATQTTVNHTYFNQAGADDLVFGQTKIISSGEGRYDFILSVTNPNPNHYGSFRYSFFIGEEKNDSVEGFILPQETKYVMFLAKQFKARPTESHIEITDVVWHRINKHEIKDWDEYRQEHMDININNSKLSFAYNGVQGENKLFFNVINRTPYNYYQVYFTILLTRGDNVVAVNRYGLNDFMSISSRQVELNWPGVLDQSAGLEIVPEINFMNQDNYIDFPGLQAE